MPIFDFICEDCAKYTEEWFRMNEERTPPLCKSCGGITHRAWTPPGKSMTGDKERTSSALGVHPSQIADGSVFKMHPGARFNSRGDMILGSRTEQKQRLKERGWVNKDDYN